MDSISQNWALSGGGMIQRVHKMMMEAERGPNDGDSSLEEGGSKDTRTQAADERGKYPCPRVLNEYTGFVVIRLSMWPWKLGKRGRGFREEVRQGSWTKFLDAEIILT